MARTLLFLTLLSYCSRVSPQPTLTQPASLSGSLGQTSTLSCSISNNPTYTGWYQQKPGQGPRYVQADGYGRGKGIPDRFTASRSGNMGSLTITNIQTEDEADYYCMMWYSSTYIFGGGTELTAQGGPTVSPSVTLFPPSKEQMKTKNQATLTCLYDGFYPSGVEIQWLADGNIISEGVDTARPMKQRDGSTYMGSSYLTLSRAEWESHNNYSCKVTHDGKSIEKMVRRSDVPS